MYVFEITRPGDRLEGIDDEAESGDTEALLWLLCECIADAAVGLFLFESVDKDFPIPRYDEDLWLQRRDQTTAIRERLRSELPRELNGEERWLAWHQIEDLAQAETRRLRWEAGEVPTSYVMRMSFIHARSFVYALDTLHKALDRLLSLRLAPAYLESAYAEFSEAFPALRKVRNSAHHAEDRIQGKEWGKRIKPQPILTDDIHAPEGFMLGESLIGHRFGMTNGDGHYGEVEVSKQSAEAARDIVQSVLNAYTWRGHPRSEPL